MEVNISLVRIVRALELGGYTLAGQVAYAKRVGPVSGEVAALCQTAAERIWELEKELIRIRKEERVREAARQS